MSDQGFNSLAAYWRRRVDTFQRSISKRAKRFLDWKQRVADVIAIKISPQKIVYNNQFKQYALDAFRASQLKPSAYEGFVRRSDSRLDSSRLGLRAIAFYLPQYHPIPENDLWWGKGFTEWSNVTRAVPQFIGHYQPRLPGDFGFYDLRTPGIMQQQIELARQYGIHGFCFHHYWFNGRRLLERPVQDFLKDPSLDIGFCLCWANENWSRRWDGSEHEILMPQAHSAEDDLAFIDDLVPAFRDSRYIRVDGKPVLIVYRATLLPDAAATALRWRARMQEHGFDGIYLVAALSFDVGNPKLFGFDAGVEFPPHQTRVMSINEQREVINPDFKGYIHDLAELAGRCGKTDPAEFICHKAVMPGWDNCARKLANASVYVNGTPSVYANWLDDALQVTLRRRPEERLLFINAWNEWGEGAYLEPDRRFGYAYINATANVLARTYRNDEADGFIEAHNRSFTRQHRTALLLHLYYEDLLPALLERYLSKAVGVDFLVSVRYDVSLPVLQQLAAALPNVYFIKTENRGRDIQPFLKSLEWLVSNGYAFACKVHTKKSQHLDEGDRWREQLMDSLLGAADAPALVEAIFDREPKTGVLVPAQSIHSLAVTERHIDNRPWLDRILKQIGCQKHIGSYDFEFSAGSMFWFRVEALRGLLELKLGINDFELETGQLDGTLAHAIERLLLLLAARRGYAERQIDLAAYARTGDRSHLDAPGASSH